MAALELPAPCINAAAAYGALPRISKALLLLVACLPAIMSQGIGGIRRVANPLIQFSVSKTGPLALPNSALQAATIALNLWSWEVLLNQGRFRLDPTRETIIQPLWQWFDDESDLPTMVENYRFMAGLTAEAKVLIMMGRHARAKFLLGPSVPAFASSAVSVAKEAGIPIILWSSERPFYGDLAPASLFQQPFHDAPELSTDVFGSTSVSRVLPSNDSEIDALAMRKGFITSCPQRPESIRIVAASLEDNSDSNAGGWIHTKIVQDMFAEDAELADQFNNQSLALLGLSTPSELYSTIADDRRITAQILWEAVTQIQQSRWYNCGKTRSEKIEFKQAIEIGFAAVNSLDLTALYPGVLSLPHKELLELIVENLLAMKSLLNVSIIERSGNFTEGDDPLLDPQIMVAAVGYDRVFDVNVPYTSLLRDALTRLRSVQAEVGRGDAWFFYEPDRPFQQDLCTVGAKLAASATVGFDDVLLAELDFGSARLWDSFYARFSAPDVIVICGGSRFTIMLLHLLYSQDIPLSAVLTVTPDMRDFMQRVFAYEATYLLQPLLVAAPLPSAKSYLYGTVQSFAEKYSIECVSELGGSDEVCQPPLIAHQLSAVAALVTRSEALLLYECTQCVGDYSDAEAFSEALCAETEGLPTELGLIRFECSAKVVTSFGDSLAACHGRRVLAVGSTQMVAPLPVDGTARSYFDTHLKFVVSNSTELKKHITVSAGMTGTTLWADPSRVGVLVGQMPDWETRYMQVYPCKEGCSFSWRTASCRSCPPGKFRSAQGKCLYCSDERGVETYADGWAFPSCKVKARGTYSLSVNATPVSMEGWYIIDAKVPPPGSEACPDVTVSVEQQIVARCPNGVCLGSNQCHEGNTGLLCTSCALGYENVGPGVDSLGGPCFRCPLPLSILGSWILLACFWSGLVFLITYLFRRDAQHITSVRGPLVRLLLMYFQTTALTREIMDSTAYCSDPNYVNNEECVAMGGSWLDNYWTLDSSLFLVSLVRPFDLVYISCLTHHEELASERVQSNRREACIIALVVYFAGCVFLAGLPCARILLSRMVRLSGLRRPLADNRRKIGRRSKECKTLVGKGFTTIRIGNELQATKVDSFRRISAWSIIMYPVVLWSLAQLLLCPYGVLPENLITQFGCYRGLDPAKDSSTIVLVVVWFLLLPLIILLAAKRSRSRGMAFRSRAVWSVLLQGYREPCRGWHAFTTVRIGLLVIASMVDYRLRKLLMCFVVLLLYLSVHLVTAPYIPAERYALWHLDAYMQLAAALRLAGLVMHSYAGTALYVRLLGIGTNLVHAFCLIYAAWLLLISSIDPHANIGHLGFSELGVFRWLCRRFLVCMRGVDYLTVGTSRDGRAYIDMSRLTNPEKEFVFHSMKETLELCIRGRRYFTPLLLEASILHALQRAMGNREAQQQVEGLPSSPPTCGCSSPDWRAKIQRFLFGNITRSEGVHIRKCFNLQWAQTIERIEADLETQLAWLKAELAKDGVSSEEMEDWIFITDSSGRPVNRDIGELEPRQFPLCVVYDSRRSRRVNPEQLAAAMIDVHADIQSHHPEFLFRPEKLTTISRSQGKKPSLETNKRTGLDMPTLKGRGASGSERPSPLPTLLGLRPPLADAGGNGPDNVPNSSARLPLSPRTRLPSWRDVVLAVSPGGKRRSRAKSTVPPPIARSDRSAVHLWVKECRKLDQDLSERKEIKALESLRAQLRERLELNRCLREVLASKLPPDGAARDREGADPTAASSGEARALDEMLGQLLGEKVTKEKLRPLPPIDAEDSALESAAIVSQAECSSYAAALGPETVCSEAVAVAPRPKAKVRTLRPSASEAVPPVAVV